MMRMRGLTVVVVRVVRGGPWNYNLAIAISASIKPTAGCKGLNGRAITRVIMVCTRHRELVTVEIRLMVAMTTLNEALVHHSVLTVSGMLRICLLRSKQEPETDYRHTQYVSH